MKVEIELSFDQLEHIMRTELMYQRDNMRHYLNLANDGDSSCFFSNDIEEEKKELRRHMEALDLVLQYYTVPQDRKYD